MARIIAIPTLQTVCEVGDSILTPYIGSGSEQAMYLETAHCQGSNQTQYGLKIKTGTFMQPINECYQYGLYIETSDVVVDNGIAYGLYCNVPANRSYGAYFTANSNFETIFAQNINVDCPSVIAGYDLSNSTIGIRGEGFYGVYGNSSIDGGAGVVGYSSSTIGGVGVLVSSWGDYSYGIYSIAYGSGSCAGYFAGNVYVGGILDISTKPAKPKIYDQTEIPSLPSDTFAFWYDPTLEEMYLIVNYQGSQYKILMSPT
ncbi:MAG: hypothetical protein K6T16_01535 [Candidatus Pacearchaeota archaeon]|nr:hypothetical protein [Candidatus Pacearchaeota archaeon]